jgi:glutamate synthase (ferredoxin)
MPGRILLVDTNKKRMISDEECKMEYSKHAPYGEWLSQNLLYLHDLDIPNKKIPFYPQEVRDRLYKVFGYTYGDVKDAILPMAENGIEPTVSMGHDVPLAVLSEKHQTCSAISSSSLPRLRIRRSIRFVRRSSRIQRSISGRTAI